MRKSLLTGVVLAVAAVVVVAMSAALEWDLESTALLGVGLGAVVALVPDRSPLVRLAGFFAGVLISWIGYVARAAVLPDTASGRAVAIGIVVLLCAGVAAATMNRVPLWSVLLGAAGFAGAYEFAFAAAPPELPSTSVSAVTILLFNVAVGFLVTALVAPAEGLAVVERRHSTPLGGDQTPNAALDDMMMEKTK